MTLSGLRGVSGVMLRSMFWPTCVCQSSGGGTESGPGGKSTGKEAGTNPTAEQCAKGWDSSMRITQAEFNEKCKKN